MYTQHHHHTKCVRVPVSTENINTCLQDTLLPGCFAGWQVLNPQTWQPAQQQLCGNLKFRNY